MNKLPYIIAEVGCNHNGDIVLAKELMDCAKNCGCDAVKFQLWKIDELVTKHYLNELNNGTVKLENVSEWKTPEIGLYNIFDQVKKYALDEKGHIELFSYAREIRIDYSSTAINKEGVDFLIDQKASFIKLASMDVNNLDLIEYTVNKGYRVFLSLGMASLGEIENAISVIPERFKKNVTLLHCNSVYPPRDENVNLRFIYTLKNLFGLNVGYSDHTIGIYVPLAAIALGASAIEKHFTIDKDMPGWDHKDSANPVEMEIICNSKRIVNVLGNGKRELSIKEMEKRAKLRRSIVAKRYLKRGIRINKDDLTLKRPGTGIQPNELKYVLGRILKNNVKEDQIVSWKDL